jgi:hypothetical protein
LCGRAGELETAVEYLRRALAAASNIGDEEGGEGRGMGEAWQQRSITHANLTAILSALGRWGKYTGQEARAAKR